MKKELRILIYIALVVIAAAILVFLYIQNSKKGQNNPNDGINDTNYCNVDSDCVAASCCHSTSCVNVNAKPRCDGVFCTLECRAESLDCGQGSCKCVNRECKAVIK
ncbi:hypothetical protein J4217_01195 [Candidatus Pacearchaeota archaeon]|nr:hypothetical protein [Candidatus Pacearchaeota archaeon]